MSFRMPALLCAPIALLAATPSAAAVFTYSFTADGTGTRASGSGPNGPIATALSGAVLSFTINVSDGADTVYGYAGSVPLTVSSSATGVGFSTSPGNPTPFFAGTGRACFTNSSGLLPTTGSYTADPNCGSITFREGGTGGFGYNFSGTITSLAVTAGGTLDNVGVVLINAVPEPATWALMLAGFAMTGYALRRRRASVAFA